jgi:glycerol kinase
MKADDLGWLVRELRAMAGDLSGESDNSLVLAIDQGGHASRVIVFDRTGMQLAESFTPISTFRAGLDRVEHDPNEIVDSIRTALDDVAETLGSDAERVAAAGIATQRSSVVCWDRRSGKHLSPVLSWQDRRNVSLVEKLRPHEDEIRQRTGLVLTPHYGASKLRWCLDELPGVRQAREDGRLGLGPLASFLLFWLLAERPYVVDPANASRTQLWDPATRAWSPLLATRFGVPLELLPRSVPTRHAYGTLAFAGRDIPLVVCTGDQSAAPFAFGAMDPDTLYVNLGTGGFLQRATASDESRLLRSVSFSDEQRHIDVLEGTVNGAASALDWLKDRIGIDAHRAASALTRNDAVREAPIFLNGVGGVGSPYWRTIDTGFVGEGDERQQVQAVVESIAFLVAANAERMNGTHRPARIVVSGGLSRSAYLCECVASLTELKVERASVSEATALGLTYLVAEQPEAWRPPNTFEAFVPLPDSALRERYERWKAAMGDADRPGA